MLIWLLLIQLFLAAAGCAVYPDPSSEIRNKTESGEAELPPEVERTEPPPRPSTTCPAGMRGSC